MSEQKPHLVDLVTSIGQPPEGVDLITNVIASVPPEELERAIWDSSFSYAWLEQIKHQKPDVFQSVMDNLHPEHALAQEIGLRQQVLSRPMRRLATLATVAVIGVGGFFGGYEVTNNVKHSVDKSMHIDPKHDHGALIAGGVIGGGAGTIGGFVATFTGLGMAGKLARKPAQRIVRNAQG